MQGQVILSLLTRRSGQPLAVVITHARQVLAYGI